MVYLYASHIIKGIKSQGTDDENRAQFPLLQQPTFLETLGACVGFAGAGK